MFGFRRAARNPPPKPPRKQRKQTKNVGSAKQKHHQGAVRKTPAIAIGGACAERKREAVAGPRHVVLGPRTKSPYLPPSSGPLRRGRGRDSLIRRKQGIQLSSLLWCCVWSEKGIRLDQVLSVRKYRCYRVIMDPSILEDAKGSKSHPMGRKKKVLWLSSH